MCFMDLFTIFILLISGVGAGVITGLVGASAVMVMAPLLILALDISPYVAIGLSLATDVVASLAASRIYYRHKKINIVPTIPILLASFIGVVLGSYLSLSLPQGNLSGLTGVGILLIGLGLIAKRNKVENGNSKKKVKKKEFLDKFLMDKKNRMVLLALFGFLIGLNAGAFGAGGGMMLLVVLIFVLGFGIHEAIGTSILIMVFLAFFGAVSHYYYHPFPTLFLIIAAIGGFFGARYSSVVANMISEKNLKLAAGVLLVVLGFLLALKSFFFSLSF